MSIKEISASLYAWDLADEGVKRCLDNLQERVGVNSAYLVALMHREKRPLHQRHYPHNPKRKNYFPEDSRAYWKPDMSMYEDTCLKPLTSDRDFLKGVDWLDMLIKEARSRGMKTGAEISHTIFDARLLLSEHPELLQQDVYGETSRPRKRGALPCVNNTQVKNYLVGLFKDLVKNYDIDFVQTCLVLFAQGGTPMGNSDNEFERLLDVSLGGCFCPACAEKAAAMGYDWEAMKVGVKRVADVASQLELADLHDFQMLAGTNMTATNWLLENQPLFDWLCFRRDSVTNVMKEIHTAVHAINPKIDLRYNTYLTYPELAGLDFAAAYQWVDSVRESDYSEQAGTIEALELKRQRLLKLRRTLGDKPMITAFGVRPQATSEVLHASCKIAVLCGSDGVGLGHYDGATMERLEVIRKGLEDAEGFEHNWVPPSQQK